MKFRIIISAFVVAVLLVLYLVFTQDNSPSSTNQSLSGISLQ